MTRDRTILLVEDNPSDEALTLRAFKKNRLANPVFVVRDGAEALDYLFATGRHSERDASVLPHLIVLDLKLPKVDGLEVLKAIRAHPGTRLLPVVVLTSSAEETDLVRSYELGANGYVQKPVSFSDFVEAMKHLGMFWLVFNQNAPSTTG